jgi:hypothetical protein
MIISKTSPVSEDKWIHRLLVSMERVLLSSWSGVSTAEAKFYGRADFIDGKYYFHTGNKNLEVLTDKHYKFLSFVAVDQNASFSIGKHNIPARLVCQGNLKSLYPSITHRADAELRKSVIEVLLLHCDMPQYLGYNIIAQDNLKDMQPFHTFELNFNIVY